MIWLVIGLVILIVVVVIEATSKANEAFSFINLGGLGIGLWLVLTHLHTIK